MRTSVWYWRHGSLDVEPHDDEEAAYYWAYYGQEDEQFVIAGFSYEDGTAAKVFTDLKYLAFRNERDKLEQARYVERAKQPPPEMITIPVPDVLGLSRGSVRVQKNSFDAEDLAYLLPLNGT